jgi:hypothetical protein
MIESVDTAENVAEPTNLAAALADFMPAVAPEVLPVTVEHRVPERPKPARAAFVCRREHDANGRLTRVLMRPAPGNVITEVVLDDFEGRRCRVGVITESRRGRPRKSQLDKGEEN